MTFSRKRKSSRGKSRIKRFFRKDRELGNILGSGMQGVIYSDPLDTDIVIKCCGTNDIINENIMNLTSVKNIGPKYYGIFKIENRPNCYIQEKLFPIDMEKLECGGYDKDLCKLITELIINGIFHNDIKFDNMLLTKEGELRLIDFDLASEIYKYGFKSFDVLLEDNCMILLESGDYRSLPFTRKQRNSLLIMRPFTEKTIHEIKQEECLRKAREKALENTRLLIITKGKNFRR